VRVARVSFPLVLAVVMGASTPAWAADPPAATARTSEQRAVDLFEKSAASYRMGRFEEAAALLREAYALKPVPVLLYNLARAYEGLGDFDRALQAYTDYLAKAPNAPDIGAIQTRIATLQHQIAERDKLKAERAAAEQRAALVVTPAPSHAPVVPWIVAGVGGAGLAAGVALGVVAQSKHTTATNDPVQASAVSEQSTAKTYATMADVTLIAGGVVAAGGVLWGILSLRRSTPSVQVGQVHATLGAAVLPGEVRFWAGGYF
jgi:tetratricopeptide (TPR) repeat protein